MSITITQRILRSATFNRGDVLTPARMANCIHCDVDETREAMDALAKKGRFRKYVHKQCKRGDMNRYEPIRLGRYWLAKDWRKP